MHCNKDYKEEFQKRAGDERGGGDGVGSQTISTARALHWQAEKPNNGPRSKLPNKIIIL